MTPEERHLYQEGMLFDKVEPRSPYAFKSEQPFKSARRFTFLMLDLSDSERAFIDTLPIRFLTPTEAPRTLLSNEEIEKASSKEEEKEEEEEPYRYRRIFDFTSALFTERVRGLPPLLPDSLVIPDYDGLLPAPTPDYNFHLQAEEQEKTLVPSSSPEVKEKIKRRQARKKMFPYASLELREKADRRESIDATASFWQAQMFIWPRGMERASKY